MYALYGNATRYIHTPSSVTPLDLPTPSEYSPWLQHMLKELLSRVALATTPAIAEPTVMLM
jgi:hypothetical protein